MSVVRPIIVGFGVLSMTAVGVTGAAATRTSAPRTAAIAHAKPTVSPSVAVPGGRISVRGTGCRSQTYTYGVELAVVTTRGTVVASGFVGHSRIRNGVWTASIKLPASLRIGKYLVASTCDQYQYTFSYPRVALPVRKPLALGASAPASVKKGKSATLTVRATSGRSVVKGLRLAVQYRPAGKKAFHVLTSVTTNAKGRATLSVRPTRKTTYRVTAPTGAVYRAAVSPSVVVKVKAK